MKQQKKADTGRELIGVRLTANTEDTVRGFVIVPPTVTPGVYPNEKGKTIMKTNKRLIITIPPNPTDDDLKEKIILGAKHCVLSAKLRDGTGQRVILEEIALRDPVMPVPDGHIR
jgi:hypothetical protein